MNRTTTASLTILALTTTSHRAFRNDLSEAAVGSSDPPCPPRRRFVTPIMKSGYMVMRGFLGNSGIELAMHRPVVTLIVAFATAGGPIAKAAPRLALVLDSHVAVLPRAVRARDTMLSEPPVIPLSIRNIRIELVMRSETPVAALTFEISNDGANSVTDILLDISIVRKPHAAHPSAPPPVLAAPFTIRAKSVLRAGFSMHYELRLRNLPPDCDCEPNVEVLSVRSLSDSQPGD